jgi:uncharacterized protein YcsI (UPF0317 family)
VHDNLCIVPKELALDFAAFCQRNPKPCPLIGLGSPGNPTLRDLGDLDIRTDLPRYCVFKDGNLVDEPTDVRTYWSDDLVTFVLGCSMSFELPLRLSCTDLCGGREVTRVPTATGCLQLLSSVTLISLANAGVVHARIICLRH